LEKDLFILINVIEDWSGNHTLHYFPQGHWGVF